MQSTQPGSGGDDWLHRERQTLSQLLSLLDFARDIDRNADDNAFARNGGVIHYVFDYNVFDAFANPMTRGGYFQNFHSDAWRGVPHELNWELRPYINAQLSLVGAEYLLSGTLPGQKKGVMYLTHGHFMELQSRLDHEVESLRAKITVPQEDAGYKLLTNSPEPRHATIDHEMRRLIEQDMAGFVVKTEGLDRYRKTRELAQELVSPEPHLSLEQYKRIASPDFSERMVPLTQLYALDSSDQDIIRSDARQWQNRFDEERERRGGEGPGRSPGSLHNDALSLALLLRIIQLQTKARELSDIRPAGPEESRDERLVLVTGDSIVFSAYRRWYAAQSGTQPFVLRRLTQYSPIINLNDACSDVRDHRELFERTRVATEAALFVFNLADGSRGASETQQLSSGRDDLAVRLADLVRALDLPDDERGSALRDDKALLFFASRLREWLPGNGPKFMELGRLWQSLERFSIGVSHEMIVQRAGGAASAQAAVAARNSGLTEIYLAYVEASLTTLAVGSLRLMFPFVTEFLLTAASTKEFEDGNEMRVPVTLRLSVPATDADRNMVLYEVQELLGKIREQTPEIIRILDVRQNDKLAERPQLVYGLAAALALRIGRWPEAERFAELATPAEFSIRDASASSPGDNSEPEVTEEFEFWYLAAVAKRFRIGSWPPRVWRAREDVWHRYLNGAVKILDRCERHHAARGELVREMRAVSERAAARLFYASWAAITSHEVLARCNFDIERAIKEFRLGLDDLRKCIGLEPATRAVSRAASTRTLSFEVIRKQYTGNLAAAHVLSYLLTARGTPIRGLLPEECEQLTSQIHAIIEAESGQLTVAATDAYAFLALENKDVGAATRLMEPSEHSARLPLDRDTLAAVRQHIRSATNTKEQ